MRGRMRKLKLIAELEEGDVLAEPLVSNNGTFLLPSGTPINIKQIKMMKMWNVKQVLIQMDLDNFDSWLNDDILLHGFRVFKNRCPWVPNNHFDEDIFQMGVIFEARKYMNELNKGL